MCGAIFTEADGIVCSFDKVNMPAAHHERIMYHLPTQIT
jgi:hypothetical protein